MALISIIASRVQEAFEGLEDDSYSSATLASASGLPPLLFSLRKEMRSMALTTMTLTARRR
jgi:hypothetical protein